MQIITFAWFAREGICERERRRKPFLRPGLRSLPRHAGCGGRSAKACCSPCQLLQVKVRTAERRTADAEPATATPAQQDASTSTSSSDEPTASPAQAVAAADALLRDCEKAGTANRRMRVGKPQQKQPQTNCTPCGAIKQSARSWNPKLAPASFAVYRISRPLHRADDAIGYLWSIFFRPFSFL
jgi:hypothetical protein